MKGYILYKIYYGDLLVYLGRTKQDLQQRIRGHFLAKPMHKKIDIFNTSKIEYAEFKTEADMYLYEVYYINKFHPPLNVDDRAKDNLTVELPEVEWNEFKCKLMDKWKSLLSKEDNEKMYKRNYGPVQRLNRIINE
jgi:excinuclease UvrABC nuclease subunit